MPRHGLDARRRHVLLHERRAGDQHVERTVLVAPDDAAREALPLWAGGEANLRAAAKLGALGARQLVGAPVGFAEALPAVGAVAVDAAPADVDPVRFSGWPA